MVDKITKRIINVDQINVDHQSIIATLPAMNAPRNIKHKATIVYSTAQPITVGYMAIEFNWKLGISADIV
jgi:tRNA(Arg) A34 adenosine deaminase TadA